MNDIAEYYDFTSEDLDPFGDHADVCDRDLICDACAKRGCRECMSKIEDGQYCERHARCHVCGGVPIAHDPDFRLTCEEHCTR